MNRIQIRRRILLLGLVLLGTSGCARILGGSSLPSLGGEYRGAVVVQGQSIAGTLEILQEGPELTVDFRAPEFGLVAAGSGTVDGEGRLAIELDYDLQCDGTATLEGLASPDGRELEGTILAADCTGTVQGSFAFSR